MFDLTPLEARGIAKSVRSHYQHLQFRVSVERPAWPDALYRTTLTCVRAGLTVLVEAQASVEYHSSLKRFRDDLAASRRFAELFLATGTSPDSAVSTVTLRSLDLDGVGLLLVSDSGRVVIEKRAMNWAYVVNPDPTLRFGSLKSEVEACFAKYNRQSRMDGMRDLCDMGERETRKLTEKAIQRGWFGTRQVRSEQSWSDNINLLASVTAPVPPHSPVIDDSTKGDLHSFRDGRNLVDHPPSGRDRARRRVQQLHDRMSLGARMIAVLVARNRSLSR